MRSPRNRCAPEQFSEDDDDKELLDHLFSSIDDDGSKTISQAELTAALEKRGMHVELKRCLESLLSARSTSAGQEEGTAQATDIVDRKELIKALEILRLSFILKFFCKFLPCRIIGPRFLASAPRTHIPGHSRLLKVPCVM